MNRSATRVTEAVAFHGEGPFWDDRGRRLLFVDMLAGAVLETDGLSAPVRHQVGRIAAVVRAREKGGFIIAVENGFAFADDRFEAIEVLPPVFDDPAIRMNDGGCDPQGRFYCGTMAYDETPGAGTLYRLDPDGTARAVLDGVTISNGLQFSDDGSRAYYVDTPTGRVDVFDFEGSSGILTGRRPFAVTPEGRGSPDGTAIDADGGIWVALWGGGGVCHYDAQGSLVEVVDVPAANVTACAFGGDELATLFITTSRLGLAECEEPEAGSIFSLDAGVSGARQHRFAG